MQRMPLLAARPQISKYRASISTSPTTLSNWAILLRGELLGGFSNKRSLPSYKISRRSQQGQQQHQRQIKADQREGDQLCHRVAMNRGAINKWLRARGRPWLAKPGGSSSSY